jgi:hypothetical protein
MLLLLQFLLQVFEFWMPHPNAQLFTQTILPLLQRIGKQVILPCWHPNNTISSKWDVLQAITYTLAQSLPMPAIAHVKGHQDRAIAYAMLSLEAQMNVDADAAANFLYQETQGASRHKAPRITGVGVHLLLKD